MQKFFNVINSTLIKVEHDQEVLEVVPPPELHMLMGLVNHKSELIRRFLEPPNLENKYWEWCDSKCVTRRGYNGANKFDGNNASRYLKHAAKLKDQEWWPEELNPVLDCLKAFEAVKSTTFSWELKEGWEEKNSTFTMMYAELQQYSASVQNLNLSVTWKIHIVYCHLSDFLSKVGTYNLLTNCGLANCFHRPSVVWPDTSSRLGRAFTSVSSRCSRGTKGKKTTWRMV